MRAQSDDRPAETTAVLRQAQLLALSRSAVYYRPQPTSVADLALMRRIDELHLEHPFAGARMLRDLLGGRLAVGRKHVATLMRKMGIEALYRRPNTSRRHPEHRIYPYRLRGMTIDRPNQVWAMDITYFPCPWLRLSDRGAGLGLAPNPGVAAIRSA